LCDVLAAAAALETERRGTISVMLVETVDTRVAPTFVRAAFHYISRES